MVLRIRKKLQALHRARLAQTRERQRIVTDTMTDGLVLQDVQGKVIYFNPAALEILGISEDQLFGRTAMDLNWQCVHENGLPFAIEDHPSAIALRTKQKVNGVKMGVHLPNGQMRWVRVNATPFVEDLKNWQRGIYSENGVVVTFSDITELVASRTQLDDYFAASLDLICIVSHDGVYKRVNPSFDRVLGFSPTELVHQSAFLNLHPSDLASAYAELQKLNNGKRTISFECRIKAKNGEYRLVSWHCQPDMRTGDIYATGRDITAERRSEENFRQIMEALDRTALVTLSDSNGQLIKANSNYCEISGYSMGEVVGSGQNIIDKSTISEGQWAEYFQKTMHGQIWSGDVKQSTKNGETYWTRSVVTPLLDADRNISSLLSIGFDITAQKKTELENEQLRKELETALSKSQKNEQAFKAIFDNSPIGIIQIDAKVRYVAVNEAYQRIIGYSAEELLGKTIFDVTHPDDLERTKTALPLPGRFLERFEKRYIHKSGRVVWCHVTSRKVQFQDNGEEYFYSVIEDVTSAREKDAELKNAQARLLESERYLRAVLENVPSSIFVKDVKKSWQYTLLNKAGQKLMGVNEGDVVGKSVYELLPKELADGIHARDAGVFARKSVYRIDDDEVETPFGKKHLSTYLVPTFDESGNPHLLIGISNDITDELKTRHDLELERAKCLHNAKLASLGEMSAGIAHEINNPLTVIVAAAHTMKKCVTNPEKISSKILVIDRAVDRISKIVRGLRKFSRSSEKSQFQVHEIGEIIREAAILTSAEARRHSTSVHLDIETESLVECDDIEMEQVLVNLINNAIDAVKTQKDRWVRVRLFEESGYVIIRVIDSGVGINPDVQTKLFQPFFTTKGVGEGTGLGLPIVKGILDEHHATIELLTGEPNTCFEIRFEKRELKRDAI